MITSYTNGQFVEIFFYVPYIKFVHIFFYVPYIIIKFFFEYSSTNKETFYGLRFIDTL